MSMQGQLVRSNQKDEYFLSKVRSEVAQFFQNLSGVRWWLKYHREVEILVEVAYFTLTTILGNQTLGEEYVNIIEVDGTLRRIPSLPRRLLMVLLQSAGSYLVEKCLHTVKGQIETHPTFLSHKPNHRNFLLSLLNHSAQLLDFIHKILIQRWLGDSGSSWGYRVLGWLAFVQLLMSCGILLKRLNRQMKRNAQRDAQPQSETFPQSVKGGTSSSVNCHLCLERRRFATATTCGHIFCWQCILRWIENKPQCPICREELKPSWLIRLQNYE